MALLKHQRIDSSAIYNYVKKSLYLKKNHKKVATMKSSDKELLIAKNLFCKNPSIEAFFKKYFSTLIKHEKKAANTPDKFSLLEQADSALSIFCEKADLNDDVIKRIDEYQLELGNCFKKLDELAKKQEVADLAGIAKINDGALEELQKLKKQMSAINSQTLFDHMLNRLAEIDGSIDKDSLTKEQQKCYEELTKEFSTTVSEKVNHFNAIQEREYNNKALKEIHNVYFVYKNEEKKYKVFNDEAKELVSRLFNYNSNRLTTEVQIYYNHVYSYIFSKLNDEDKFELTKMSLKRFDVE